MARHRRHVTTLGSLSARQWTRIAAAFGAVAMLMGVGVLSHGFYTSPDRVPPVSEYSATDPDALQVSRGITRESLKGNTSYVTVTINGKSRVVLGTGFTDVKSVLDSGDITLQPTDTVSPSLTTKVGESTVITIERAGAKLETSEEPIAFNTVRKETPDLPTGTERVQTEGTEGIMETTSLVTRTGDRIVSSNVFASYVKQAPVDKVILVGTGSRASTGVPSTSNIGTTVPVGDMQQWAHDYLLSNGYTEADFTATVFIISHESGWRVNATNASSGAYGLPQALPGGKMASAGADWSTNYQTQLRWFWNYCAQRYGSIQGAYSFWQANRYY